MLRRIIILAVALTICVSIFGGCKESGYTYKEGDFSLEVTVNKTEVRVGEEIEVTATFRNLTGRDIPIAMRDSEDEVLEDIFGIMLLSEDMSWQNISFTLLPTGFAKEIIGKDSVIVRADNLRSQLIQEYGSEPGTYKIAVCASFFTGKEYEDWVTVIHDELLEIRVVEGETE